MSSDIAVLQRLLATEHSVVWAYGVLGAKLADGPQDIARQAEDAHRARRDTLRAEVRDQRAVPVAAAAAYTVPFAVTDAPSALRLAVALEGDVAAAYRAALGDTDSVRLRQLAVAALQDAAVRAARWRSALAPGAPATVALPGTGSG